MPNALFTAELNALLKPDLGRVRDLAMKYEANDIAGVIIKPDDSGIELPSDSEHYVEVGIALLDILWRKTKDFVYVTGVLLSPDIGDGMLGIHPGTDDADAASFFNRHLKQAFSELSSKVRFDHIEWLLQVERFTDIEACRMADAMLRTFVFEDEEPAAHQWRLLQEVCERWGKGEAVCTARSDVLGGIRILRQLCPDRLGD